MGACRESELAPSSDTTWRLHDGQTDLLYAYVAGWLYRGSKLRLGSAGRGGICFYQRSSAPHRHVSLWTQDVRDDGDLGDARRHSWPDAGHAGLRADLASGRQDRLLQIAGDRFYTEDASGAGIPPAGGSRVEGSIASRYFGGWSDPRRPRDPDRARRRVSSARRAYN